MINKYDVDLVNIRLLFEKIEPEQKKILLKSINKSNRKKYFINNNGCLNFFKKIDNKLWTTDIYNLSKQNINLLSSCILINSFIKNFLNINPKLRKF